MIKLSGITLRVKKIRQGRFGDFCVADLSTDIGEFKVKDPILDQFDDGEYTGTVWISEIFLSQYMAWGKAITEIRARLHDLQLDGESERAYEPESLEPDPVEEVTTSRPAPVPAQAPPAHKPSADLSQLKQRLAGAVNKTDQGGSAPATAPAPGLEQGGRDEETIALMGDLWPLILEKKPVKFDSTVDRLVLRKQSAKMVQLGYKFNAIEQTWYPV